MLKIIAMFALANIINAYEQEGYSAELTDETIIQYCMLNDFESKETQDFDLESEGFGKPKTGL